MKNSKTCPKCASTDIVVIRGEKTNLARGNVILTGSTIFNAAIVNKYVCCNCGFIEEWVEQPQDLPKIKSRYHDIK